MFGYNEGNIVWSAQFGYGVITSASWAFCSYHMVVTWLDYDEDIHAADCSALYATSTDSPKTIGGSPEPESRVWSVYNWVHKHEKTGLHAIDPLKVPLNIRELATMRQIQQESRWIVLQWRIERDRAARTMAQQ